MNSNHTRRDFILKSGAATLALATLPAWAADGKKITVAFVGVAHIHTPNYLKIVKQRPDVQIKYVWDNDAVRAARREAAPRAAP